MTDTALPLIIALDPGRRCGFAIGRAGEIPRSGVVVLRKETEGREVGLGNLIAWMQITLSGLSPHDLRSAVLIHEEAMGIMQWIALCESIAKKKPKIPGKAGFKWFNAAGIESGHELNGVILGMAQRFGIERREVRRQTVLATVTGKGSHGGRDQAKLAVIQAIRAMGLVEANCTDDDKCDAIANYVYASTTIYRKQVGRPSLFGATA